MMRVLDSVLSVWTLYILQRSSTAGWMMVGGADYEAQIPASGCDEHEVYLSRYSAILPHQSARNTAVVSVA